MDKKLISIRLNCNTLDNIEKITGKHSYWKRSDVINNILGAVFENFDEDSIYNMIRAHYWKNNVVDCKFEITQELKPYKKQ